MSKKTNRESINNEENRVVEITVINTTDSKIKLDLFYSLPFKLLQQTTIQNAKNIFCFMTSFMDDPFAWL